MSEQSVVIQPFKYSGTLETNASKSYFQRALAIAALANYESTLHRVQWSADTKAACQLIQNLGASVNEFNRVVEIKPASQRDKNVEQLNVGESGLALRMFSSVIALFKGPIELTGEGSLLLRPIKPIIDALQAAGVQVKSNDGKLPLFIDGPLEGGDIHIDGSFSSQIITGLLISLPLIKHESRLIVKNPTSIPYLNMTMDIMSHFGVDIEHNNHEEYLIKGRQSYTGTTYHIEGDWSGAANHVVGAAISGEVSLKGLNPTSSQADRAILDAVKRCGAIVDETGDAIHIKKAMLEPFEFNATHCPDIFPPLVVLACACKGQSILTGTDRLLHKESNRLEALIETFGKLGVRITKADNQMIVHGEGKVTGAEVDSFNDHRIAMAAALAASISDSGITIHRAEAINKSYPNFYEDLKKISQA